MALSITVNGAGTFTASMEEGPVSFTASLGAVGPQGPAGATGPTGVVAATAPILYDSGTQTVSIDPDPTFNSVTAADVYAGIVETTLHYRFPDLTLQTTAFVGEARKVYIIGRNNTGTTIAKGKVVRLSGATGNKPTIALAQADTEGNSARTIGITVEAIADNADGKVIVSGAAENIDTSAFNAGDTVHLSASTAGGLVTALPTQPLHGVVVGIVTRANPSVGSIEVAINNYQELEELSDVLVSSKANNDLLAWDSTASVWKNRTFSALGLLTSATAASTYAPIVHTHTASQISDSTSAGRALLTAADASAQRTSLGLGTMAVETAANYALLASPTFSGTPSLPTGTIAVTQAAGNNTTAVATTAFVQQEVPAASTTVSGKVELATDAEAVAGTDTSRAVTPDSLNWSQVKSNYHRLQTAAGTSAATNGASSLTDVGQFGLYCISGSASGGYGLRRFPTTTSSPNTTKGSAYGVVSFSNRITLSGRLMVGGPNNVSHANATTRVTFGKSGTAVAGDLSARGFGIKYAFGSAAVLTVHNGTTLTDVTSSFTPSSGECFEFVIESDGSGNVTLFVNGSSVATTSAGPTGNSAAYASSVFVEIENTGTPSGSPGVGFNGGWLKIHD